MLMGFEKMNKTERLKTPDSGGGSAGGKAAAEAETDRADTRCVPGK
jgi:hypothetical protein